MKLISSTDTPYHFWYRVIVMNPRRILFYTDNTFTEMRDDSLVTLDTACFKILQWVHMWFCRLGLPKLFKYEVRKR